MNEKDAVLASRAAGGQPEAAEELARQHGPAAYRLARSLGLGEHDAEDVAQEVIVRLLGMLERYDPEKAALSTLVYRMTTNAVCDARRKLAGFRTPDDSDVIRSAPARGAGPAAPGGGDGVRQMVLAAAESLPERQRQVFILHDIEELSVAQAAAALEISETNVRVQLCSARRALRERLAHLLEG